MYAELLLKKPSTEDTPSTKGSGTEYAEIVYVNSGPAPPAADDKKS